MGLRDAATTHYHRTPPFWENSYVPDRNTGQNVLMADAIRVVYDLNPQSVDGVRATGRAFFLMSVYLRWFNHMTQFSHYPWEEWDAKRGEYKQTAVEFGSQLRYLLRQISLSSQGLGEAYNAAMHGQMPTNVKFVVQQSKGEKPCTPYRFTQVMEFDFGQALLSAFERAAVGQLFMAKFFRATEGKRTPSANYSKDKRPALPQASPSKKNGRGKGKGKGRASPGQGAAHGAMGDGDDNFICVDEYDEVTGVGDMGGHSTHVPVVEAYLALDPLFAVGGGI